MGPAAVDLSCLMAFSDVSINYCVSANEYSTKVQIVKLHGFVSGGSDPFPLVRLVFSDHKLPWIQLMAAAAVFLSLLSVLRRPVVFRRGTAVLNESGVSILDWIFFSWGLHSESPPLSTTLNLDNLPRIPSSQSSTMLREQFDSCNQTKALWMQLATMFRKPLVLQASLVLLGAASEFGSRFVVHSLLKRLEKGLDIDAWTWIWVALLPASLVCVSACDNWSSWIGHTRIQLPILGLLQSLAFEKSMRLRWASGDTSTEGKHTTNSPSIMDVIESHCNTIAQAFLNAHNLPIAALKIILYSFYLSRLMGFTTVIIGGTLPILAIWLSRKLSKYQRRAQLEHIEATERTSALVSEALRGLRQIRLSSMECLWQKRVFAARNQNLAAAWKVSVFEEIVNLVATLGPVLFASVTISIYALRTGHFSPSVAFTSINLFGNLHAVIKQLPARFASLHRARISYSKLQTYLRQPEQTRNSILGNTISLQNANLSWVEDEKGPILKNVDLVIPKHGISLITGQVGSGKSLLLYSILEEAIVQSGKLVKPAVDTSSGHSTARGIVAGSAAFVSQPPWIEDCTIKENICLGYEFDEDCYRKVLHACALTHDLETLSNGDLTAAGTGGSLLSGGQKWRVAFARALYSPAEFIISEDVLAAVDTAVARHLCDAALGGNLLRGRTMIMATHHPEYCSKLPTCLISLQNGSATVKHVQDSKQTLASLGQAKDLGLAPTTEKSHAIATDEQVHEATSTQKPTQHSKPPNYWVTLQKYAQKTGSLHGYMLAVPIVLCYRLLSTSNSWWLAKWTSRDNSISQQHSTKFDVGIYLSLSVASAMFLSVQTLIFTRMGHNSSRKLFESLTRRILKARLSWIDSTPPGQVIQTLDSDMYAIDHRMAPQIIGILSSTMNILFIRASSFSSSPYTILFSAFMLTFYAVIARKALEASQRLRPILNSCNFPVSNHTASAQSGLTTIRAFGKSAYYIEAMRKHIDRSNSAFTHLVIGHSWLGIRLGLMGSIFVATVTAATILSKGTASSTGLAITLALQLRQSLNITIGQINVTRTGLNAIDRVLGLASIPSEEEDGEQDGAVSPENWPSHGQVKVRKLGVRYSENLPWTLSNISFSVQAGQRLGIVGRTGAGKSSLINSLLRFVDATAGEILIDDQDISQVSRKRVRDAVTVIPQDAFLFSGTLRSNVDVFGKHNDDEVISALRSVHFTSFERKGDVIAADLDRTIHSGGSNVSHGQRQLVCLARVILEDRSRILILDEATSGVEHLHEDSHPGSNQRKLQGYDCLGSCTQAPHSRRL
ncbi:hypothetical protein BB8028_0005g06060 [Beauveria bassiana]|uniref:Uncharacterized protein n=1 Tax=Beauveria bassiana TaxID=176275 RepID=A0A2S7YFW8_BEABA|nr:hypothetical protein BB8028_0005g06060 [Beauveria bassiana]